MLEQTGGVRRFYSRPGTYDELLRRLREVRNVLTDSERKERAIVKLEDPIYVEKFVYAIDTKGNEYVIAIPSNVVKTGHRGIVDFMNRLLKRCGVDSYIPDTTIGESDTEQGRPGVYGGGFIALRYNRLLVFGKSQSYGEAPKERVVQILQRAFPDVLVKGYPDEEPGQLLEHYLDDLEAIKDIVYLIPAAYRALPDHLKNNREIVLETVRRSGFILRDVPEEFKHDREIVLAAVRSYGEALEYAYSEFRDDEEIVREAIKNNKSKVDILSCVSPRLRDNKEIVLMAAKNKGFNLANVSERLRDDKEVVLEAVRNNGWNLQYASERLRDDEEIVREAIKTSGLEVLKFASERLRKG
jgi:hypothetical protein